jgi:predicted mannosyl-3-phosphoglycerate phosphatase (HAD superfamily)
MARLSRVNFLTTLTEHLGALSRDEIVERFLARATGPPEGSQALARCHENLQTLLEDATAVAPFCFP